MDTWIDIPKFSNYQASISGEIRNKHTGRIIKSFPDRYGYLRLSLGNTDNIPVHRLICETFYGPPPNDAYQVNHIDCNRQNNHVSNLEWCTPSENIKWGIRNGKIDPKVGLSRAIESNLKPVRIIELDKIFYSVKECAEFLGVPPTNVSRCLVGSRQGQRLHGYHIEFI